MGTDIHIYAEKRKSNKWVLCEPMEIRKSYSRPKPRLKPKEIYGIRNYALFAILANVNNPAYSAEPYECISTPRGLPLDISKELKVWADWWKKSAFGYSWLNLKELQDFDWQGKQIIKKAMVDKDVAALFGDGLHRFPYHLWPKETPISYALCSKDGITVTWLETYAESAGIEFTEDVIGKLCSYGSPNEVRVVFWFDR